MTTGLFWQALRLDETNSWGTRVCSGIGILVVLNGSTFTPLDISTVLNLSSIYLPFQYMSIEEYDKAQRLCFECDDPDTREAKAVCAKLLGILQSAYNGILHIDDWKKEDRSFIDSRANRVKISPSTAAESIDVVWDNKSRTLSLPPTLEAFGTKLFDLVDNKCNGILYLKRWKYNDRIALSKNGSRFRLTPMEAAVAAGAFVLKKRWAFSTLLPKNENVGTKLLQHVQENRGTMPLADWDTRDRVFVTNDGEKLHFGPKLAARSAGIVWDKGSSTFSLPSMIAKVSTKLLDLVKNKHDGFMHLKRWEKSDRFTIDKDGRKELLSPADAADVAGVL